MLSNTGLFVAEHHPSNCILVSQSEMMYPHLQPLCPSQSFGVNPSIPGTHPSCRAPGGLQVCAFRRGLSPACKLRAVPRLLEELRSSAAQPGNHGMGEDPCSEQSSPCSV